MSLTIGVDPGKDGAFALLDSYGELVEVADMPVVGKWVSSVMVAEIIGDWISDRDIEYPVLCLEDVYSSPQQGVTSAFSFGRSKGLIEGVASASDCRLVTVTPAKWKREMGLTKDKNAAREMAMNQWPSKRDLFKRVKDDGRAEAALIGLWQVRHGQA